MSTKKSDYPRAEFYDQPIRLGDREIQCCVLDDSRSVLWQGAMLKALSMSRGGNVARRSGGDRLERFVTGEIIKPYASDKLLDGIANPITFINQRGSKSKGYEATLLAELCEAVLAAREAGELQKQQLHIAKQCEILVRGFMRVGIVALVHKATGYDVVADRLALQEMLDKYVTDEWAKWTKQFPDDYYIHLFRLRGIPYPPRTKNKPSYIGHWTNNVVYSRLERGVLQKLREKNPRQPSGHRKRCHHQHLTRDIGIEELRTHLHNVIFLMRGCTTWDDFMRRLNRAAPKLHQTYELPLNNKDGESV